LLETHFIFGKKGRQVSSLLLLHWIDVRLLARAFMLGVLSLAMIDDYLVGLCVSVCFFICVHVFERKAWQLHRQRDWPSRREISRPVWLHGILLLCVLWRLT